MKKRVNYSNLSTEQPNRRSRGLDRLSPLQLVNLMNREDRQVVAAVGRARAPIARAVERIARSFMRGGRLFLVGAGTSGRLAVLEAAECPPTFNSGKMVQAIMAGGNAAVFQSQEGAEDSASAAARAIRQQVRAEDVVVGIAASGVTAFARAALETARKKKAGTILITCNASRSLKAPADILIQLKVGPEVLSGSTRLKSGTACKMALNMLTTGSMVRIGKVYDHWMVDLQPKSAKLVARGLRLIQLLGGVSPRAAEKLFLQADRRVKPAILMARKHLSYAAALTVLRQNRDFLRAALEASC